MKSIVHNTGNRRARLKRFTGDVLVHTPFAQMIILLFVLWMAFSAGMYAAEQGHEESVLSSYLDALYWSIAAFSTAGIADTPHTQAAKIIGGIWIVLGSTIFFGSIVATVTTYFMRPMQRPARRIVEAIEYSLEQMDELTVEELALLKKTTDAVILHMENLKARESDTSA